MEKPIYQKLTRTLLETKKLAVAFSGGVDSSLLAYVAREALGDKMVAITVKTPYIPEWEIKEAENFTKKYAIPHTIIELEIPSNIRQNPPDRCYLCKKEIFQRILEKAREMGISTIADGSNTDDLQDYRPGMRALKELQISSPLLQLDMDKQAIRDLSQELGLSTWNKPAYACLLSRIPYHTEITTRELKRIAQAELAIRSLNILGARVRSHGDIARLEVNTTFFPGIIKDDLRKQLIKSIKDCGYSYVTLDLDGYQTGSLNKALLVKKENE